VSAAPNSPSRARAFEVRHLQLARALFAALAAIMVTFSSDHSAAVGLSVFSGWAIATAIVFLVAAWQVYTAGSRVVPVVLGVLTLVAGMVAGLPGIRSTTLFFALVITWSLITGLVELVSGIRGRGADEHARDAILVGSLTIALGLGLLVVNPAYSLEYFNRTVGEGGTLTGITIGVGIFGGYAAIIAVFLGIAGFSPRRLPAAPAAPSETDAGPGRAEAAGEPA